MTKLRIRHHTDTFHSYYSLSCNDLESLSSARMASQRSSTMKKRRCASETNSQPSTELLLLPASKLLEQECLLVSFTSAWLCVLYRYCKGSLLPRAGCLPFALPTDKDALHTPRIQHRNNAALDSHHVHQRKRLAEFYFRFAQFQEQGG